MRYVCAFLTLAVFVALPLAGQTYREERAAATEALEKGDLETYLAHMLKMMELDPDRPGRPFYQYGIARALAQLGQPARSLAFLEQAWREQIEGPMIAASKDDPAFETVRVLDGWGALMNRVAEAEISVTPLSENVSSIDGAGCGIAVSIGPDGVLLVDSGYSAVADAVRKAIAKRSTAPVRFVINTHEHQDHIAGNATIAPDGVLVAHPAARVAAGKPAQFIRGLDLPPLPERDWPAVTSDSEISIHFNGERVRIIPLPAHSESDLLVWFEKSAVLHMGDNYFPGAAPALYPGTAIRSYFETLGALVETLPEKGFVVTGHSGVVPLAQLRETWKVSKAIYDLAESMIAAGKSDEEILAAAGEQGLPQNYSTFYVQQLRK